MQHAITLYEVLEVSPGACAQVIRAAYRVLAQSNHPDKRAACNGADERQAQINHAYFVLSDPIRRQCYDQTMPQPRHIADRRGTGENMDRSIDAAIASNKGQRPFAFRPLK
jgi:DnaJ-class molecular chaperone